MLGNFMQRALSIFKDEPKAAGVVPMPMGEVAWSESQVYGSKDFSKYNPDTLIGTKGFAIYRKMMLDEQVKAVVHFKRDAITARKWYFEFDDEQKEALGEEEAERRVKVFTHAVRKMPGSFVDGLNAMMSAMYHGYSLTEKVYQQMPLPEVDGKEYVVLKALKMRPFDTFNFYPDTYGNIEKLTQTIDFREQVVDITRFVHFVCNPDVDPHYGQSELREAYRAWFSKDHAIKFRNIFLERMAGGLISLEAEKGISIVAGTPAHTDIMNLLANVQTKTGWLLPAGIKANIHYPGGKNENYEAAIASDDKAIAKALLVPPLLGLSEQGSVGAYSQSQTQLEAFMWTLDGISTRLAEACNEQLFTDLGDLNFGDGVYPKFCFHPLSDSMVHTIIGKWKELVTAGAVEATDTDETHLRELLDFPEKGEPIKKPVAIDPITGLPLPPGAQPAEGEGGGEEPELDKDGKPIKKAPIGKDKDRHEASFSNWNEEDHPRGDDGKWIDGGGRGSLSGEEEGAVSTYAGDGFLSINNELRSGSSSSKTVKALDKAIEKSSISSDKKVYRGMTLEAAQKLFPNGTINKGDIISDKAFLSTSKSRGIASMRGLGGVVLEINLPKGSKALDVSSVLDSGESEVLLGRNSKLKILGIKKGDGPGAPVIVRVEKLK